MTSQLDIPQNSAKGLYRTGLLGFVVACVLVGGLLAHKHFDLSHETRARQEALAAGPLVRVHQVSLSGPTQDLVLQGEALPQSSVILYAKLSGYLRTISVDKGDRVRAGQTLAVIESLETDRDYQSLQADAENKRQNARRAEALGAQQLLSARDVEQAQADARIADAKLASQAVQRGYQVVKAPFDGTITARFADPGALMQNAANSQSSALPLVTLAKVDRLKVTLYLDQRYAALLHQGDAVNLASPDRPGGGHPGPGHPPLRPAGLPHPDDAGRGRSGQPRRPHRPRQLPAGEDRPQDPPASGDPRGGPHRARRQDLRGRGGRHPASGPAPHHRGRGERPAPAGALRTQGRRDHRPEPGRRRPGGLRGAAPARRGQELRMRLKSNGISAGIL